MTRDGLAEQKQAARKAAFARRKAAHDPVRASRANEHLTAFLASRPHAIVAAYMAIRTEVDPMEAMEQHAVTGTVGVPVILGEAMPLEFHKWTPGCEMKEGPFGASVPASGIEVIPEIVILPLVAFDQHGTRLGYGGGFYDRTLAKLRADAPVEAIGFAYGAQETTALPREATDLPLDAIITEDGLRHF